MRTIVLIISFVICECSLSSQTFQLKSDTLNRLDSLGRKTGYWVEYLSKDFRIVKKKESANYYWYIRYSQGIRFHSPLIIKGNIKKFTIKHNDKIQRTDSLFLLDGEYKLYEGRKHFLSLVYIFKKGILQSAGDYSKDGEYSIELFSEKYNQHELSYLMNWYSVSGKLQYANYGILEKGRWRTVKKEINP